MLQLFPTKFSHDKSKHPFCIDFDFNLRAYDHPHWSVRSVHILFGPNLESMVDDAIAESCTTMVNGSE